MSALREPANGKRYRACFDARRHEKYVGAVQKQYNIVGTWKCEWYEGSSWFEFKGDGTFSDWSLDENNEIQGSVSTGVYSFDPFSRQYATAEFA